ncbi:hypothetical protein [Mastigocoleus testarum]|uniref:Zinc permease n=1 Tax=Mastigocoleus testarum BC008 TaxID=371196 RepID=A0A0V7ZZK4_9CYAN|nr:hypothetical protein [Mastigocoleus testarum]KST69980.1 hypothetical protein BC008_05955 [Mastigocoleus testarum BC008]
MPITFALSGFLAVALALIHLFCGKLRFVDIPRSRWLSGAGGVSVAYVFIHLLPELGEYQSILKQSEPGITSYLENHVYLIALIGLGIFYWLERLAILSRQQQQKAGKGKVTSIEIFWLNIVSFAIYNSLIGYLLLHREETDIANLISFASAMALHFIVNDHGLRQNHRSIYDHVGKWILAFSIIFGWVIGTGLEISESAIAILFSFLAGGIILNVLKEELPEERESRFWAFASGAFIYAVLSNTQTIIEFYR